MRLTVGSAFDIPFALRVAGLDASVTVTGEATVLEAARSQIAGTVPQSEVQSLPMNGRNFLDLALLIPGVSPTNVGSTQLFAETSAVPGQGISIGSQRNLSNSFIVDGLSANDDAAGLSGIPYGVDAVEQFQVVTSGGQAELGRALGGYINVVTKSGTNARHGTVYDFIRDDNFNARNALSGNEASDGPAAVRRQSRRPGSCATGRSTSRTSSSGCSIRPAWSRSFRRMCRSSTPGSRRRAIRVLLSAPAIYPNPVHSANFLGKVDHQVSGSDQITVRYSLYHVTSDNSRGAGALNAPTASAGLDNVDHSIAFGNTWTISSKTVNETRAQFAYGDLKAPPTDSDRSGRQHRRRRVVRHAFGQPDETPQQDVPGGRQPLAPGGRARTAGGRGLRVQRRHDHVSAIVPGQLCVLVIGELSHRQLQRLHPDVRRPGRVADQSERRHVRAGRVEGRVEPDVESRPSLRPAVPGDDQHRHEQRVAADRFRLVAVGVHDLVVRGSGGLFFDRVPLRAVANAILSAGNTTDLDKLHQPSVSGIIPTQDGAPTFPNILPARLLTTTLVDFSTMDEHLQNAYSKQASIEVERSLGASRTVSVGYQYIRGENLLMSVNQNVPTCVAAGTNNGCRPTATYRNNNQYSSLADSNYHGLHVSFVQRPTTWASVRLTYTLSKSMNDVGEAFFSSPIDPTDIMRDWGRSDDDQRHRLVINGTINTSMAPAATTWEHISHGFQVSGMLQYYSALPFNITSGVTSLQGTDRPAARGRGDRCRELRRAVGVLHSTKRRNRQRFLQPEPAREPRDSPDQRRLKVEGLVEAFNLTNRVNNLTRNANFGARGVSHEPRLHVQPDHCRRRSEDAPVRRAGELLDSEFT